MCACVCVLARLCCVTMCAFCLLYFVRVHKWFPAHEMCLFSVVSSLCVCSVHLRICMVYAQPLRCLVLFYIHAYPNLCSTRAFASHAHFRHLRLHTLPFPFRPFDGCFHLSVVLILSGFLCLELWIFSYCIKSYYPFCLLCIFSYCILSYYPFCFFLLSSLTISVHRQAQDDYRFSF